MQSKFIHTNNQQLHYRMTGKGNPVMLVHGFGEDGHIWNKQVEYLQQHYQLIIPDLPGSGRSTMVHGPWSIDHFAESLKQIFDKENISKAVMIGHSMGGYITLAFEELYSGRLSAFGLFHSTSFADSEEKKQNRRKGIEFIREHGPHLFLKQTIPGLFSENFRTENPAVVNELLEAAKNFSAESLIGYYEAMIQRPDRSRIIKQSVKAVLLVMGEEDKAVPLADSLKQSSFAERSLIKIMPFTAHMGMLEATETSNKTLEQFLELVKESE